MNVNIRFHLAKLSVDIFWCIVFKLHLYLRFIITENITTYKKPRNLPHTFHSLTVQLHITKEHHPVPLLTC